MQGVRKQSVTSAVFDDVFVDADALGSLDAERRAKLDRVVSEAIREATRRLERMRTGASRYIMKERIDYAIDLEREPGTLAKELAAAIVARIEVRLGMRISDQAGAPTVPSTDSLSLGLAEPRGGGRSARTDASGAGAPAREPAALQLGVGAGAGAAASPGRVAPGGPQPSGLAVPSESADRERAERTEAAAGGDDEAENDAE